MTAAPVGIIDADDAADVGRVLSKGRDQTRIGHAADLAVAAVDRHDAADVAVAKDVTAVRIVLLYAAAGKATSQTAHKPAAEHVALAGLAAVQHNFLAVADKAADEITLEGAGVGQCAVFFVEARLDLLLELGLGQVAAGHAFAALQGHAPAVARNAAEELPQHQAARIALGIALIVGARADRAVVPQARQALGHAGVRRKQVADDAARKAVAGHKAVVDDVRLVRRLHLRGVHRAEHAAHADAAPEGVLVTRLGCRGSVAGLLGLLVCRCVCNGLRVLVHKQTRHRHVRRNGQVLHDGIRFGYGNADETANAAWLVYIIGIVFAVSVQRLRFALRCGGSVVKRQRRGHQRTGRGVRAAGQGAVFQRAGVDAAECADGTHIAPVLVFLRQRRDEFGCGQLELVCLRQRTSGDGLGLDVDLNVRVAQCDVRNFALVLADKADIVVGQLVLLCPAGFCNGLAAQLQIEDGNTGRLVVGKARCFTRKYDFFAQFRDRRPGDRVIEGRHLGRRVLPTRRAVDRDAAARPVQAGAVAGLGGQRVGALVGDVPVGRPAQVVQMAEIFQVCFIRRAALGQQGVFLVRRFLFAGCVGVAVVLPRLGAHGNVDVLRVVQQAGDAVQARSGNVSVVLTRAQQRRVRHGVQRQHKAALVVA